MYEVLGIGAPLVDHLIRVEEKYLDHIGGEKWGMELVSYPKILSIIENSGSVPTLIAGGSAANAIKGLQALGHPSLFVGKCGRDPVAATFFEGLQKVGVTPSLSYSATPTGHVACLITPDGKRTCRTFVGASSELENKDLPQELFHGKKLVHIEGYALDTDLIVEHSIARAKEAGALVSFDLGSFELVKRYRKRIIDLLPSIDILFANQEEAEAFSDKGYKEACKQLQQMGPVSVVMLGKEGCYIGYRAKFKHIPTDPVEPIDTTGAGDLFASGFLHGILTGRTLSDSAKIGALCGRSIVQVVGAELPIEEWEKVRKSLLG